MSEPRKVVIVGAGAAGLGAARWLVDNMIHSGGTQCVEVTVLEARNRTGGRVHTYSSENSSANGLYDVGASWIHDPSINPISIMAKSLQLQTLESDYGDEIVTDLKGQRYNESTFEKDFSQYELTLFPSVATARTDAQSDSSIEELLDGKLDKCNHLFSLFLSGLEFELGSALRNCSATECIDNDWLQAINGVGDSNSAHLESYSQSDDYLLPESGFAAVVDGIRSGAAFRKTNMEPRPRPQQSESVSSVSPPQPTDFTVLLNHEVTQIEQMSSASASEASPGKVRLTVRRNHPAALRVHVIDSQVRLGSADGENEATAEDTIEIEADAVILTVPLGVLKHGDIRFAPPLSAAKQRAIEAVGFGNVVKVIVEFSQVFWPTHTLFLALADAQLANPQDRGLLTYFLNGHKMAGKKVLVGYGLGDGADRIDAMTDEELTSLIMSRCAALALPGRVLPAAPLRVIRTRWREDPYARGAYSYWAPGNLPGIRAELGRREGSVWFAGEAVHESSLLSSSVHGAWMSGVSSAAKVCAHLALPVSLPTVLASVQRRKKKKT